MSATLTKENRAIAELVTHDVQCSTISQRHKDAMYAIANANRYLGDVTKSLDVAAQAIEIASSVHESRAARMKKVLRQPQFACCGLAVVLMLGMSLFGRVENVSETTDSPAMAIYREAVALEKDGNVGKAFDKYVAAAKMASAINDADVLTMATNRVTKTQRNG